MEVQKEVVRLLNFAYRYLSYRMRTEQEIKMYLFQKAEQKHIPSHFIDKTIDQLKEEGYINDTAYIQEFIHSRSSSKPKSEFVLSMELRQKGVSKDLIDTYFEANPLNEKFLAKKALQSKWSRYSAYSSEERTKKAIQFLLRRGFTYDIIKKTIEELASEE